MAITYEPIASATLSSANSVLTVSSIPGTYTDLRVIFTWLHNSSDGTVNIRMNSSFAETYYYNWGNGDGASATTNYGQGSAFVSLSTATATTTIPGLIILDIFQYANTSYNKTMLAQTAVDKAGSGNVRFYCGLWPSTSAVSSIRFSEASGTSLKPGTSVTVYGITKA